jgi:thiol peroxidase|tara:strand:- start:551 stop:1051 length:501 start_codon:yes stop_codon:yes gene_type:complete
MTQIKLGDQVVDLSGTMPSVGSKAPDFLLANNDLVNMTLKDFEGKRLILNIFPSLATPVCSASAHKFNELASGMNNTVVICISKDLAFSQKQFCSINNLDNLLFLSDMRNHDFANDYGILHMNGKFQGLLARSVVVINTDATIGYTQLVDQTGHEPNYDKVLDVLI